MVAESPHTTPGFPHTGCATTCPQARPVTPPPGDDVCPQNILQHPSEEHVMAQHQGHQTGVSSLLSLDHLVTPQCSHTNISLQHVALPAAVSPSPDEPTLSATPPRTREVPHLHIQTSNK
jgi:hypothetical protein